MRREPLSSIRIRFLCSRYFSHCESLEILDAYAFFELNEVSELTKDWVEEYNTKWLHEALTHPNAKTNGKGEFIAALNFPFIIT